MSAAPVFELPLGVEPPPCTRGHRLYRPVLRDAFAPAIAVDAARAEVDHPARKYAGGVQCAKQIRGADIALADRRGRHAVKERVRRLWGEHRARIEIEAGASREASHREPALEERRGAPRDVAEACDEERLHAGILFAEIGLADPRIVEELGRRAGERDRARLHDVAAMRDLERAARLLPDEEHGYA